MIHGARRLSDGSTKDWHGGEEEFNPRYMEPMKLAAARMQAQRELDQAKVDMGIAYHKAAAAFVAIGTFLLGAVLYTIGLIIASFLHLPPWLGGTVLVSLGLVTFVLGYPMTAIRGYLKAVDHERVMTELLQHATDEANEKQRQLDEDIKIVDIKDLAPKEEKVA